MIYIIIIIIIKFLLYENFLDETPPTTSLCSGSKNNLHYTFDLINLVLLEYMEIKR